MVEKEALEERKDFRHTAPRFRGLHSENKVRPSTSILFNTPIHHQMNLEAQLTLTTSEHN